MQKILNRLENLKKKYPIYNNFFDFYGKILITRKNFSKPKIERNLKINEEFPLLENFKIDLEHAQGLFFVLCQNLKDIKEIKSKIEKIENYYLKHPHELKKIFKDFLKKGIDNFLLKFLIFHSLKPSLEECMKIVKDKIKDINWIKGCCPICGHYPYMAILKKDGKRFVKCAFCSYEWQIERIFCPFCGQKNHEKIKYFEVEKEPGYRVYVCDECKRYLKTVDETMIENVADLELVDVATLYLDVLAREKGYKNYFS
ncbi:MAG: formate dehydrogenase accessory protein FdhE [Candidatus Desulfofervidus auxilii]|nr:formate dehydrogenase accessory protein FdhE [Candidatus Desulfofervidus auxilii]